MKWTQFLLGLMAFYLFYYLLNILYDLFRNGRPVPEETGQQELVFSEETTPEEVVLEMGEASEQQQATTAKESRQSISSGLLQSSGAVGIKELFGLAQAGLIEYTKTIPY